MNEQIKLADQKSAPCEGVGDVLTPEEIEKNLKQIGGDWKVEGKSLFRQFVFKDFVEAMKFVNQIADIAEKEAHHPDLHISYNKLRVELTTHALGGITINDFIVADKTNEL